MQHRLSRRVGRSSQATPDAVDKPHPCFIHRNSDNPQGSTFPELAKGTLEDVELAAPPESEHRDIAAFLDRETAKIDVLMAKKEWLLELLQEKRSAPINRGVGKRRTR